MGEVNLVSPFDGGRDSLLRRTIQSGRRKFTASAKRRTFSGTSNRQHKPFRFTLAMDRLAGQRRREFLQ